MTARRKVKGSRRSLAAKPPVARSYVTASERRDEEATEHVPMKLPPLERDVDSDESTQLGALFDERSRGEGDPIVGDPEGTTKRRSG
jgi:hypothetical protein